MEPSADNARSIEAQKLELERRIETLLQDYAREHEGPLELDLTMNEREGSAGGPADLRVRVRQQVEDFLREPVISQNGVRVHKVTAIDSDGDGRIALKVSYDHPAY